MRILAVDDNPTNRKLLRVTLEAEIFPVSMAVRSDVRIAAQRSPSTAHDEGSNRILIERGLVARLARAERRAQGGL